MTCGGFGPRLFRSRWAALFWGAGIVWTAYDVAGAAPQRPVTNPATPQDALGDSVDPAALAVLANAAP